MERKQYQQHTTENFPVLMEDITPSLKMFNNPQRGEVQRKPYLDTL